jgi:hypothetical protein
MESLPPGRKSTAMRTSPDLFTFTSATSNDGGVVKAVEVDGLAAFPL